MSNFVNIHTHSEFSPLDGLSQVEEICRIVSEMGHPAVAVTDHGVCAAHPELQKRAAEYGIKALFGLEAYFVDDRKYRPPSLESLKQQFPEEDEATLKVIAKEGQTDAKNNYSHLILIAMNEQGLRNLWAMSTAAHTEGFYYHPRLDWEVLEKYSEGIICTTACLRGPLSVPILNDDNAKAIENLSRLKAIFGNRLYIELHVNELEIQHKMNHELVKLSEEYGVPLVAAVDSHYPDCEDKGLHQTWIAMQTNSDIQDETTLFAGGQDYHIMDRDEAYSHLVQYGEHVATMACDNTVEIAERCSASIQGESDPPIFSKPVNGETKEELVQKDIDRLMTTCLANWDKKVKGKTHPEEDYIARFEQEMKMYIDKRFCGYFDIVSDYTQWSKHKALHNKGCIMGPSRGSGGACLVAYLADITEIDPIESELPLARFMTPGRMEPPDFDLDWPTSMRDNLTDYIIGRWGMDHVVRVGTHIRLKNKGVFKDVARVFKSTKPVDPRDLDAISKIIDAEEADSAGLGKPWDVVYAANEELFAPYRDKYPWLFEIAERFVGRLKSYGKHAAGLVISTSSPLTDRLPMRLGEDGRLISDFDMDALAFLGLLKFDLLTLRTLDTLQECINRIYENTGELINIYDWTDEYFDEEVWDCISNGHTMGLFQIETSAVTALIKRIKPRSMAELAAVITLVRPGPTRSGLTESYIRRKFDKEVITLPDERLKDALSETYGCIVYQEDIINTCRILAGYNDERADAVRKILGKKKVAQVVAAGEEFVPACVERGMKESAAQLLWSQMAEFAKYSFNKAHAYGYAVLSYWTAWFKVHFPAELLASALSTVDNDRIPDFVNEARRLDHKVLSPDINKSKAGFATDGNEILYGFQGVKGIADAATQALVQGQPYKSFEDFMERKGSAAHSNHILMLAKLGAFDELVPNRRGLVKSLEYDESDECGRCVNWIEKLNKYNLPCTYDWDNEPVEYSKTGKPKKQKPIPKRCTKACRNYTPSTKPDFTSVENYTEDDIRELEKEYLGVWLSGTPFDRIDPKDLADLLTGEDLDSAPPGEYLVAALVNKTNEKVDKNGNTYAWVSLFAQNAEIEPPCWSKTWSRLKGFMTPGRLVVVVIKKSIKNDKAQIQLQNGFPI